MWKIREIAIQQRVREMSEILGAGEVRSEAYVEYDERELGTRNNKVHHCPHSLMKVPDSSSLNAT